MKKKCMWWEHWAGALPPAALWESYEGGPANYRHKAAQRCICSTNNSPPASQALQPPPFYSASQLDYFRGLSYMRNHALSVLVTGVLHLAYFPRVHPHCRMLRDFFLLKAEWHFTACVHHTVPTRSSTDEYLGCFHVLAVMCSVAKNVGWNITFTKISLRS